MRGNRHILLVDDDRVDVMTVKRALKELRVTNPVATCNDGEAALAHLRMAAELPCIALLDINMPRMTGIELLRALKGDERLRRVPVVMLTTSHEESDRLRSFDLGVAGYMLKPVDYRQFVEVMRAINMYWTLSEAA